jgi:hypothetical protein
MNARAMVTLGVLLGAATGKTPQSWLSEFHGKLRAMQSKEPANAAVSVVLLGAAAFYAAERGKNPKVESFYDALVYVSTNLSVGYSDVLARTPIGKAIGSVLMTYGPAIATRALDAPADAGGSPATDASLNKAVEKLDAILQELVQQRRQSEVDCSEQT